MLSSFPTDNLLPPPPPPMSATRTTTTPMGTGYTFTHAQWKELETQAMIYKYMVASIPVPPHLLLPIIRSLSHSPPPPYYSLGYGVGSDGEPGRCKRTDGKKWRCSREVAPHQKYCDRHLHRGRPRSRKLVEAQANSVAVCGNTNGTKKTRANMMGFPASSSTSSGVALAPRDDGVPLVFAGDDANSSFLAPEPSYKESRDVDWLMIGDHSSTASAYNSFPASSYLEPTDYGKAQAHHHSFIGSDPFGLSSLTLSMAGTGNVEMGSRPIDSSSWVPLAPLGGPLAEALGHRIAGTPSNPSSPNIPGNVHDEMGSSLAAQISDSSSPSSPRLGGSPFSMSEFTVQWFNTPNNLASFAN
ncbi:hypothetical protein MLD38_030456 [Melastoma candidum]|uniref:Uncharacterized protein n=1 Tax=Melastoma candidum TaxID=119954 RepID=A0ACB9MRX4_9MYRT|nr:hypothetical protein MLD38_030456 [Melastoma candidum]